jgi:hypothetical protein
MAYILAVQLSLPQEMGGGVENTGYRPVLSVRFIETLVQTFRVCGDTLYQLGATDSGSINNIVRWNLFLMQFTKPMKWAELDAVPMNPTTASSRLFTGPLPSVDPPVSEGLLTVTAADYDPIKGWWIEFAGNYDIACPIFRDFPRVRRLTPNYRIRIG